MEGMELTPMDELFRACYNGNVNELDKLYITNDEIVNSVNKWGLSALKSVCFRGYVDCVRYLVEKCGVSADVSDLQGNTPFMLACASGSVECVKYLVEECKVDVNAKNDSGNSCMHFACEGSIAILRYLLEDVRFELSTDECRRLVDILKDDYLNGNDEEMIRYLEEWVEMGEMRKHP